MSLQVGVCIVLWCGVSDVSSASDEVNMVKMIDEWSGVQKGWLLIYMLTGFSFPCKLQQSADWLL